MIKKCERNGNIDKAMEYMIKADFYLLFDRDIRKTVQMIDMLLYTIPSLSDLQKQTEEVWPLIVQNTFYNRDKHIARKYSGECR